MRKFIITLLSFFVFCSFSYGFGNDRFLTSDEAFNPSVINLLNENPHLYISIAPKYYLYKDKIIITPEEMVDKKSFPVAKKHSDPLFGDVEVYENEVIIDLKPGKQDQKITVQYQGCTEGLCYPVETKTFLVPAFENSAKNSKHQTVKNSQIFAKSEKKIVASSEQNNLAEQLNNNSFSIFWFLILGIGLAFTPCILPMLPLLSAIVIGQNNRPTGKKAFFLTLSYVQGMALTYTLLGLIVVSLGAQFQIALQSPVVLAILAIIFTALALSMFGLFDIRLPRFLDQKINNLNQKQQGGSVKNAFVMGMVAGLVASPCTSAPLSGALLYVAQTGDYVIGGLSLYLLGIGMGIPLMLVTIFGNKIIPKSGNWLFVVKKTFGFVMLSLPAFLLGRIYPQLETPLFALLGTAFLIWIVLMLPKTALWHKILQIILMSLIAFTAYPIAKIVFNEPSQAVENHLKFTKITSLDELENLLKNSNGKKAMLDFYADWCVACKEFEKYTFSDLKMQEKLQNYQLIQVDMTENSAQKTAILEKYQVFGMPSILFFKPNGNEIKNQRITGFLNADEFLKWVK